MQTLKTRCGTPFLVDDDVWEWAKDETWYLQNGYPCRNGGRPPAPRTLHRELFDFPIGHVHHRDENPLNVQRSNLEVKSPKDHCQVHGRAEKTRARLRRVGPRSSSGFKGVSWHRAQRRWVAQLCMGGKNVQFAYTRDPEEAAVIYDAAVIAFLGKGAFTNLIPNEEQS